MYCSTKIVCVWKYGSSIKCNTIIILKFVNGMAECCGGVLHNLLSLTLLVCLCLWTVVSQVFLYLLRAEELMLLSCGVGEDS